MPAISVVFYREQDGSTPFLDWFNALPDKAKLQCRTRLGLLASHGHELRRPAADYLRDGIYELRAKSDRIQYRLLYFFDGQRAVVVSHGLVKQQAILPTAEIETARRRKRAYESNPERHAYREAP